MIIFHFHDRLYCQQHSFSQLAGAAKWRMHEDPCLSLLDYGLDICFDNINNSSLLSSDEEEWMHHDTSAKQGCGQFGGRGSRYLSIGSVYVNMLGMRQLSG